MKYKSTRGKENGLLFEEVLFSGYSKDGGLYMPEEVPKLSESELISWAKASYIDLMQKIVRKFISIDEITDEELSGIINSSYSKNQNLVHITSLFKDLNLVELFHGPTLAFKDMSMFVMGNLLSFFLNKNKNHAIALVGTAGDTGSASIMGVKGQPGIDIVVLYPKGRCTRVQELQMTTVLENNVNVICVDGTSDELDRPIKQCFSDPNLVTKYNLLCMNSINWMRILGQIPHFFFMYFKLCKRVGDVIEVVVPTGACGNITAGSIAYEMGLPIRLVAAVNGNDIVAKTINTGYMGTKQDVIASLSSAMDIQVPYNIERILYMFCGNNTGRTAEIMAQFEETDKVTIPEDILKAMSDVIIDSFSVCDKEMLETMRKIFSSYSYTLCPHSAVAVSYHYKKLPSVGVNRAYVCTASPAKFGDAVRMAGLNPIVQGIGHLSGLQTRNLMWHRNQNWTDLLKEMFVKIADNWHID